jgi:hypothetical protein
MNQAGNDNEKEGMSAADDRMEGDEGFCSTSGMRQSNFRIIDIKASAS